MTCTAIVELGQCNVVQIILRQRRGNKTGNLIARLKILLILKGAITFIVDEPKEFCMSIVKRHIRKLILFLAMNSVRKTL
jgi:hypothetical protein